MLKIEVAERPDAVTVLMVRGLNTGDVFTVLSLLASSVGTISEVEKMFTDARGRTLDVAAVGVSTVYKIITGLMIKSRDETLAWLGSLVEMTGPEFEKLPPTTLVQLCEALASHGDLMDFFEQCTVAWSSFIGTETESDAPEPQPSLSPNNTTESKVGTDG